MVTIKEIRENEVRDSARTQTLYSNLEEILPKVYGYDSVYSPFGDIKIDYDGKRCIDVRERGFFKPRVDLRQVVALPDVHSGTTSCSNEDYVCRVATLGENSNATQDKICSDPEYLCLSTYSSDYESKYEQPHSPCFCGTLHFCEFHDICPTNCCCSMCKPHYYAKAKYLEGKNSLNVMIQSQDEYILMADKAVDIIEDLWIAYENISSAVPDQKVRVIVVNVIDFVKKQANISPAKGIKFALQYLHDLGLRTTSNDTFIPEGFFDVQSFEESVDYASFVFKGLSNMTESAIMQKLNRCLKFCLTFAVFEKLGVTFESLGYTVLEQKAVLKKFSNKFEFFNSMTDLALFITQRGIQIFKTGDINTIFHSSSTYDAIYSECQVLNRQFKFLDDPEALGFTESSFRGDLDAVIEKLESCKKHSAALSKFDRSAICLKLDEMRLLQDTLNCRSHAMKTRHSPFGIMIYGDSGIGKSTIVECLFQYFCKLKNLPNGSEYKYTLNAVAKYWDNFRSQVHTLVVDDIACENPDNPDTTSSVTELIRICNHIPYCPDQAALENKGKTPLRVKFVIATSNSMNMNAHVYGACPSAIQRRLPIIVQPKVKPEFRVEDGKNLDASKVGDSGPFPDLWDYDIYVVDPVELDPRRSKQSLAVPRKIKSDLSQREFYAFLKNEVDKYDSNQRTVRESLKSTADSQLCRCCQMPPGCCFEVQAGDYALERECFWVWARVMFIWGFMRWFFTASNRTHFFYMWVNFFQNWWYHGFFIARLQFARSYCSMRMSRTYFANIGRRIAEQITPEMVAKYTLWIAFIYYLRKMSEASKMVQAADVLTSKDIGKVPMKEINGRENVWYNNDVQLSSADFTRPSASSRSVTFEDFCKKLSENVLSISTYYDDDNKRRNGSAICLYGQVYLTNNHSIPEFGESTTFLVRKTVDGNVAPEWKGTLCNNDVYRLPDHDLAIVVLRNIRPKKNILKYIIKDIGAGTFTGSVIVRKKDGSVHQEKVRRVTYTEIPISGGELHKHSCPRFMALPNKILEVGDCGSPMVIETGAGYAIIGIHVASSKDGMIFSNAISGMILDKLLSRVSEPIVQSGNFSLTSSNSVQRKIGPLHKKSVFRYIPEAKVEIFGSFLDFRGSHTSKVENTPMSVPLKSAGYTFRFKAPEMKSWIPWHIGAKDIVNPITTLRTDILKECRESYLIHLKKYLSDDILSDILHPLDNFTAINGAQTAYIDKLNRNTSMGNPYKKSKKYFLTKVPPQHGMLDPVEFDDEIMLRVDDIIAEYQQGNMVHPNFCAHLKDEPVSVKKALNGKTRVFTGAPCDWCIVNRKMFLTACKLFQTYRLETLNACGTVAQSLEWEELYHFLNQHGSDNMVAGDYASFDKRMAPCEILNAFETIISLCEASGNYSPEEIRICWCLAYDTAFPTVDYNGDLIGLYGSNPSGHPLTVIINGLAGIFRMMYAYRELNPERTIDTFFQNVALIVYGDDNAAGISDRVPWFNHTSISEYLSTHGIEYTMADKEAKSVPYIPMSEVSFLKRTWVMNDELGAMLAPLDHASIEKMLMTWTRSKTVCIEAQGISVIESAMNEYFFYGREVFEKRQKLLKEVVDQLGWNEYIQESTFLSFDTLMVRFKASSKHTPLSIEKGWL